MTARSQPITELLGIDLPIIQAPMLGFVTASMILAVAEAGGLGSLPLSNLRDDDTRTIVFELRRRTSKPVNLNFLCHAAAERNTACEDAWIRHLLPYYAELGLDSEAISPDVFLPAFGSAQCALLEEIRPEIVSFHFGLPPGPLLDRVRKTGAKILSSATTVEEAEWLEERGCDAIIAQGLEAGGHRGTFLRPDRMDTQIGTMALVPQIVDAVSIPVIAAGGISDPRGVAAALALGAAAVQVGTAFLFSEEANVPPPYRQAITTAQPERTVVTNVFTGRPARVIETRVVREIGAIARDVPAFPRAAAALAPLRAASEARGNTDFTPVWCGQAASLSPRLPAGALTRWLASGVTHANNHRASAERRRQASFRSLARS